MRLHFFSRLQSRSESREDVTSPTKKSFKNVQAKVNSFNRVKPKVPPKPQEGAKQQNGVGDVKKPQLTKKESGTKLANNNAGSKSSLKSKNGGSNGNVSANNKAVNGESNGNINASNKTINGSSNSINNNVDSNKNSVVNTSNSSVNTFKSTTKSVINATAVSNKQNAASDNNNTIASVNNSTKTNLQTPAKDSNHPNAQNSNPVEVTALPKVPSPIPSNDESSAIDAVMDDFVKGSNDKITPMVDGRVLSATSVSNAMNKMNDSVLSTNTLIKERNFVKISPAASAIISMSTAARHTKSYDSKNLTDSSENGEREKISLKGTEGPNGSLNTVHNNNNTEFIKLGHTVSNLNKFSTERVTSLGSGNAVQKSINDRIIDVNTVVAADVQPLKINVKEKPQNADVQSGNVRVAPPAVNGIGEATPG